MPPRFPYVIGTDITHLTRWSISKGHSTGVLKRIPKFLNFSEIDPLAKPRPELYNLLRSVLVPPHDARVGTREAYLDYLSDLEASESHQASLTPLLCKQAQEYLGGRWAAKEAARKAWGTTLLTLKDIRVLMVHDPFLAHMEYPIATRKPTVLCAPFPRLDLPHALTPSGQLSISHDGDYAIATVIAPYLSREMVQLLIDRNQSSQGTKNVPQTDDEVVTNETDDVPSGQR